jgi:replicative DNA helicase
MQEITLLPPQNVEAEEVILGGILLDPEAIQRVCNLLPAEAFYIDAHAVIYKAALQIHSQHQPTDLLSMANYLRDKDQLERIGGRNKLATLVDRTVSAINIDAMAALVLEKYHRRQLIKTLNESLKIAWDTWVPTHEAIEECQRKILDISTNQTKSELVHISDAVTSLYTEK